MKQVKVQYYFMWKMWRWCLVPELYNKYRHFSAFLCIAFGVYPFDHLYSLNSWRSIWIKMCYIFIVSVYCELESLLWFSYMKRTYLVHFLGNCHVFVTNECVIWYVNKVIRSKHVELNRLLIRENVKTVIFMSVYYLFVSIMSKGDRNEPNANFFAIDSEILCFRENETKFHKTHFHKQSRTKVHVQKWIWFDAFNTQWSRATEQSLNS